MVAPQSDEVGAAAAGEGHLAGDHETRLTQQARGTAPYGTGQIRTRRG
jgi:hypothetical protein